MDDDGRAGAAEAEASRDAAAAAPGRERRMTARRKREAVLRVLRGEPLEIVAREFSVPAADLSGWRDAPLGGGRGELEDAGARRPGRDDRPAAHQARRADDGCRAARSEDRPAGGRQREPFRAADACATSAVVSISTRRAYGTARVCRVWGVARSGVCRLRRAAAGAPAPRRRPGPQGPMPDGALVGRPSGCSSTAPSMARAPARSGRGCATPACAPPRSGCAA